jgi:2-aminoadipate transaminase
MTKTYDPLASVQAAGPPGTISFVYGLPDPVTFPADDLRRAFEKTLREKAALALQYGPEQGYGPLIDYLREKMGRDEGLKLERPQVTLTGGAAQALDHISTMLTRAGDTVFVEAPTYHESLKSLRDHSLRPVQIPIDEEGLIVERLIPFLEKSKKRKKRMGFLYLIPSFQNPSGITLSLRRRKSILEACQEFGLPIVEDDVYYDLIYEGKLLPSLFSLDNKGLVLRLGSFSKLMAPGLRLGWMTASRELIEVFVNNGLRNMGGGANPLVAIALDSYCRKGLLEPHIESLRSHYRAKRDIMLSSLEESMPGEVQWTRPSGGFFIWLKLPPPLRAADLEVKAKKEKLRFFAGDAFFAESPTGQYLRLAFSYVQPEKIQKGIKKLSRIIRKELSSR